MKHDSFEVDMAVLRVAHVWGDRLLDVRHLAGDGEFGPLTRSKGRIRLNDEVISVVEGKATRLVLGETTLTLEYVERQPKAVAADDEGDWYFAKIAGVMLVGFAALVAMLILDVQLGFGTDDRVTLAPTIWRKVIAEAPPKKPRMDLEAARQKQLELTKQQAAQPSKAARPLQAKQAGILGALEGLGGGGDLFAPGLNVGIDQALNGLNGPSVGDANGLAMGGPRGGGGPGVGPGGIGPGVFGIRRPGPPSGELRKKVDVGPCCTETRVTDGLSKELVGKVIRLHFNAIKFCYERELQSKPALAGKVMILFTIDGTGSVSDANVAESSLDDANVEACMLSQIRRWKFPEPKGGGIVTVSHPWFFKPAGSED